MQERRQMHYDSGRNHTKSHGEASLTKSQEEMLRRVVLTMREMSIHRSQQDCEATLRETNFNFEKAVDMLTSPDYHPWIEHVPDKEAHRGGYQHHNHGGPRHERRDNSERRQGNWSKKQHDAPQSQSHFRQSRAEESATVATGDPGSSDNVSSHGSNKKSHGDVSAPKDQGKAAVIKIELKGKTKSAGNAADISKEETAKNTPASEQQKQKPNALEIQFKTQQRDEAPKTAEPAKTQDKPQQAKIVINIARPPDQTHSQSTSSLEPRSNSTSANTTPSKIHISLPASSKSQKTGEQPSNATQPKSYAANFRENAQGAPKQGGESQQVSAIDVMTLEQNLGRPADGTRQVSMGQPPMPMGNPFGFQVPPMNGQPNAQGMAMMYVPVYYPNPMQPGTAAPFPANGFPPVMMQPDAHGAPTFQMMPMPGAMQGSQPAAGVPIQAFSGQPNQPYTFPFFTPVQAQSMQQPTK